MVGLHCEHCRTNYYNFNSGAGCSPCDCNPVYSSNLQCNDNSGECSCKPGINGAKCTGCADRYHNLTDQGEFTAPGGGGGGDLNIKKVGVLVVLLKGVTFIFWFRLGIFLAFKVSLKVACEEMQQMF